MPPFHLSTVPTTNPRRLSPMSAREALRQEMRGARQPDVQRGPAWWRRIGAQPGMPGGGFLPR
jgi:hypothetical protein